MTHGHHHHHHHGGHHGGGGGGGGHHHHHHHGGHHHHGHHGGQALPGFPVSYTYLPTTTTVRAPLLEPRPKSSRSDDALYTCLAFLTLALVFILFYMFC